MTDQPVFTFASAFILGLLHSMEPSHAKAVLASYFLDHRRTLAEAFFFAVVVTVAHTLTIYLLAALLLGSGSLLPDSLPFEEHHAEAVSGFLMVALGAWMLREEKRANFHRDNAPDHDHACGHLFHHHGYHHHHDAAPSSLRGIFVIGFCSGSIPCMTGIAVLLQAWVAETPARGFGLLGVFSLGLGLVVLVMSVATQQAAQFMKRYWNGASRWTRYLPTISGSLILLMGIFVLVRSLLGEEH
ncbi:MAG: sulfite exporter TauE/SafE family protein [Candidatus Hydrogenedentota bacterium]